MCLLTCATKAVNVYMGANLLGSQKCPSVCAQEAEEQSQGRAEERIAKAAEAATRSAAAALLRKQQQHIPVKEDYFLPDDELGSGERRSLLETC